MKITHYTGLFIGWNFYYICGCFIKDIIKLLLYFRYLKFFFMRRKAMSCICIWIIRVLFSLQSNNNEICNNNNNTRLSSIEWTHKLFCILCNVLYFVLRLIFNIGFNYFQHFRSNLGSLFFIFLILYLKFYFILK